MDRPLLNTVCDTEVLISCIYVACVSGQRFNGDGGHIMQCVESEHYYLLWNSTLSNLSTTTGQLSQHPEIDVGLWGDADPGVACRHAESCRVNSWLFHFSIHQDIKIAIQQVWCNGRWWSQLFNCFHILWRGGKSRGQKSMSAVHYFEMMRVSRLISVPPC